MLTAYGVGGGPGLAYGIILQAVEVLTALALGIPALLGEGLTWRDIRAESHSEREREEQLADEVERAIGDPPASAVGPGDETSAGQRAE